MKRLLSLLVMAGIASNLLAQTLGGYPITQIPFTAVKITPNTFWGDRVKAARDVTVPLALKKCETEGRIDNFIKAAHPSADYDISSFMGFPFDDTDVYKTIEGASYLLNTGDMPGMKEYIDSIINIIGAAQEPDGYLYTARTINPAKPHKWAGKTRWSEEEVLSHELYNLGHMIEAACAHYQATGSTKFLDIARRYADCVIKEVGPEPGQATVVPGHQIAEMALARLSVLLSKNLTPAASDSTGIQAAQQYLEQAKYFLDYRGKTKIHDIYTQSDKPILEQKEAWGHAVRAGYQYAGMADVAALTGDSAYINAIDTIWNNIVGCKYYLTGGVGARHQGEAFGANYELPNLTAYNETCAAIAQVYFNHRMFLLHGDAKYIDCLERTLYNGVIAGMSVDGGKFFYPNPLASDGQYKFNADGTTTRQPWFGCACCPSNLSRFIPSLPGYLYATKDNNIYVNLYAANTTTFNLDGQDITLEETTQYPWNGDISIKVTPNKAREFNLMLRIPGWLRNQVVPSNLYHYCDGKQLSYRITVNGKKVSSELLDGYFTIARSWKKGDIVQIHFDMQPRVVAAHENVLDDKGKVAVERGPIVYCAEAADNKDFNIHHIIINQQPQISDIPDYSIRNTESAGAPFTVTALSTDAQEAFFTPDGKMQLRDVKVTLIPYYAWNHRGANIMDVWMAHSLSGLDD